MTTRIIIGDARTRLVELPAESVHMVCTSPPYWGLRDYGAAGQIGLEPDYREYVATLVAVFREVRRVLRADGTVWLNLGDTYANQGATSNNNGTGATGLRRDGRDEASRLRSAAKTKTIGLQFPALDYGSKPKNLMGIPWRVAFALQDDGWYLRQDIIWAKPNPMPESVTDRCTKAHEYIFLLSKSARYYFDAGAIAEPALNTPGGRLTGSKHKDVAAGSAQSGTTIDFAGEVAARNKRSVWTVTTQPYAEAHFATFPPALIEPCILAGCPVGGTILDPFFGAGTTGLVADRLGRNCIGIELNPAYAAMAQRRIDDDAGMFAETWCEAAQ